MRTFRADIPDMRTTASDVDAPGDRGGFLTRPSHIATGIFIAIHVAIALAMAVKAGPTNMGDDVARFQAIATHPGRPYRDFDVEYAPLETVAIGLLAADHPTGTARRLAIFSLLCDLLVFAGVRWGWGERAGALYLVLGLPLVPLMYTRIDMLVVALTVWGLALSLRSRERAGGSILALATLTKLWPAVVAPALAVRGRSRSLRWYGGSLGVGLAAWLAIGGPGAIQQVVTFRGATGWQVESTIGGLVWLITGGPVMVEAGARRVGLMPDWSSAALLSALVLAVWAIWWEARNRPGDIGGSALAAVCALLALSPVFSLQYAMWLIPFGAIAWVEGGDEIEARLAFAMTILTGSLSFSIYVAMDAGSSHLDAIVLPLIIVRNGLCAIVPGRRLWIAFVRGRAKRRSMVAQTPR